MRNGKSMVASARGSALAGPQWSDAERSEAERNGGPAKAAARGRRVGPPDSEVLEKARRRRFSAEYKARIVREAESCTQAGEIGALLRREGLYSSQLASWRSRWRNGGQAALSDGTRGRKRKRPLLESENDRLRKQIARLERRLEQAEAIIDIQKKVSQILGIPLKNVEDEGNA